MVFFGGKAKPAAIGVLFGVILGTMFAVEPAQAQPPALSWPLDCTLGENCFIQQFVDRDPGPKAVDFACGAATYDGHTGTDFRLKTAADMARGVAVVASAPGRVVGWRDQMADRRIVNTAEIKDLNGRECGNGVMLDHGNGWRTQYCHMKLGSILVQNGQQIKRGQALGQVGLSGNTQFPHVELSVYKGKQIIDPFQPEKVNKCGAIQGNSLWKTGLAQGFTYQPTKVIHAGFSAGAVQYGPALDGDYEDLTRLSRQNPLVAFGMAINMQKEDVLRVELSGPQGRIAVTDSDPMPRNKAQWMSFVGKKAPPDGWLGGVYNAQISVLRNGSILSETSRNFTMK